MSNELTDKAFWASYWESKTGLAFNVPENYTFSRILKRLITENNIHSAIELGGFPGYYTVFLKKYFGLDAALFDFYIHQPVMRDLLAANGLSEKDIEVIEGDLFKYEPEKQYDMVLSCGLIEHFYDTKDIIARHLTFLKPGGTLFITLPNFTGVNGWIQRTYDPENYAKHNIACMDPKVLADCCSQLGLKNVKAYYNGRFSVWLEDKSKKSAVARMITKGVWIAGKIATRIVPVESKSLSPYIIIEATK